MKTARRSPPTVDIRPLRSVFNSCCDASDARTNSVATKTKLLRAIAQSSTATAFFGLPLKVSELDGSSVTLERVICTIDEMCGDTRVGWAEFVESVVPAALLAGLSARCAFVVEAVLASGKAAQDALGAEALPERAMEAAAAARAAATVVSTGASTSNQLDARPSNRLGRNKAGSDAPQPVQERLSLMSRSLEESFEQQMQWAQATERAVEAALIQAERLGSVHGVRPPLDRTASSSNGHDRWPSAVKDLEPSIEQSLVVESEDCQSFVGFEKHHQPTHKALLEQVQQLLAHLSEFALRAQADRADPAASNNAKWAARATQQLEQIANLVRSASSKPELLSQASTARVRSAVAAVAAKLQSVGSFQREGEVPYRDFASEPESAASHIQRFRQVASHRKRFR